MACHASFLDVRTIVRPISRRPGFVSEFINPRFCSLWIEFGLIYKSVLTDRVIDIMTPSDGLQMKPQLKRPLLIMTTLSLVLALVADLLQHD